MATRSAIRGPDGTISGFRPARRPRRATPATPPAAAPVAPAPSIAPAAPRTAALVAFVREPPRWFLPACVSIGIVVLLFAVGQRISAPTTPDTAFASAPTAAYAVPTSAPPTAVPTAAPALLVAVWSAPQGQPGAVQLGETDAGALAVVAHHGDAWLQVKSPFLEVPVWIERAAAPALAVAGPDLAPRAAPPVGASGPAPQAAPPVWVPPVPVQAVEAAPPAEEAAHHEAKPGPASGGAVGGDPRPMPVGAAVEAQPACDLSQVGGFEVCNGIAPQSAPLVRAQPYRPPTDQERANAAATRIADESGWGGTGSSAGGSWDEPTPTPGSGSSSKGDY